MKYPNLKEEKKLWTPTRPPPSRLPAGKRAPKGFKRVVGLDEAGRGPIAGPVTAAAVMVRPAKLKIKNSELKILLRQVKDSKKLTPKKREELFKILIKNPAIEWGMGKVSEKIIDKINIKNAAELAMERAVKKLRHQPDFLIIDGKYLKNHKLKSMKYKLIVKADEKVFSCAAASIIAKVTRDKIMEKYAKKYPKYSFDRHKGYPTKLHLRMLKKYGPCKIHRMSFRPVKINSKSQIIKGAQPKAGGVAGGWSPTKYHFKMLKKFGPCKIHRKSFKPVAQILK